MEEIEIALFDLGGVLMDFALADRASALSAHCGLDEKTVYERVWLSGLTREFDEGRYTSREWYQAVRDLLGLRVDYAQFCDVYLAPLKPRPAVLETVGRVQVTTRTAMLTDNPPMLREVIAERFPEVAAVFDVMIFSFEIAALKPSPEAFERALARLEVRPEAVFFVDDTLANVEAARRLGMAAVHFTTLEALRYDLRSHGLPA